VGNHVFAREYETKVPDTWHLINDQDVITSTMKFGGMYKRAGQRVIVNAHGDLIVRPSFIELSLLQVCSFDNVLNDVKMLIKNISEDAKKISVLVYAGCHYSVMCYLHSHWILLQTLNFSGTLQAERGQL
jgi:hypothetical protein